RPCLVAVNTGRMHQATTIFAVRTDRKNLIITLVLADEGDQIAARRPQRKVVVIRRERGDGAVGEILDAQALAFRSGGPIDEALPIRGERRKSVVVGAGCDLLESGAVGLDHGDLSALTPP